MKQSTTNAWRLIALVMAGYPSLARAAAPDRFQTLTLAVDGVSRTALVYVPPKPPAGPLPLVFVFHGHGGSSRQAERAFQFDKLWPEAISVYPQGLDTAGQLLDAGGKLPGWQPRPGAEGDRDLRFFDALLARLKQDYAVDAHRVDCAGHSNGGGFTYVLWKARADVFAAVAPCSAAAGYAASLPPKPAFIGGGLQDPLVQPQWQRRTMDAVRQVNGCDATGVPWEGVGTLYPSKSGTPLVTFTYAGGHPMDRAEPGLIVRFFQSHPAATTRPS